MTLSCTCADWTANIAKVDSPRLFAAARNPGTWNYDGVIFRHCPWCGTVLTSTNRPMELWHPWILGALQRAAVAISKEHPTWSGPQCEAMAETWLEGLLKQYHKIGV